MVRRMDPNWLAARSSHVDDHRTTLTLLLVHKSSSVRALPRQVGEHYHYHLDNGGSPNIHGRVLTALVYLNDGKVGVWVSTRAIHTHRSSEPQRTIPTLSLPRILTLTLTPLAADFEGGAATYLIAHSLTTYSLTYLLACLLAYLLACLLTADFEGGETNWPMGGLESKADVSGVNTKHTYVMRERFANCQTAEGLTLRPRRGSVPMGPRCTYVY